MKKIPMGCLSALLIAGVVWVAIQFVFMPELEKGAQRKGHTLMDYVDRLLGKQTSRY